MSENATSRVRSHDDKLLRRGIAACKAGHQAEALVLLEQVIQRDGDSEAAWLWMSAAVNTDEERCNCLQKVLAINPANEHAKRGLNRLHSMPRDRPSSTTSQTTPSPGPGTPALSPALAQQRIPVASAGTTEIRPKASQRIPTGWIVAIAAAFLVLFGTAVLIRLSRTSLAASEDAPPVSASDITTVIYENIAAYNAEDVDRYMLTIHSQSPGYDSTRSMLSKVYSSYDLYATVRDVQVIEASSSSARVSFILTTQKVNGPAFRDNQVTGVFNLRPENGKWKIYDQDVEDVHYYN